MPGVLDPALVGPAASEAAATPTVAKETNKGSKTPWKQLKKEKAEKPHVHGGCIKKGCECLYCGAPFESKRRLFDHLRTPGTPCGQRAAANGLQPKEAERGQYALLLGYLKDEREPAGVSPGLEGDWVERELWNSLQKAKRRMVPPYAHAPSPSGEEGVYYSVLPGLQPFVGVLPENTQIKDSLYTWERRGFEDYVHLDEKQGFQAASIVPPGPTPGLYSTVRKDAEPGPEETRADDMSLHAGFKAKLAQEFEQWDITGYTRVTNTRRRVHIYAQPAESHAVSDMVTFEMEAVPKCEDDDEEGTKTAALDQARCTAILQELQKTLPWRIRAFGILKAPKSFHCEVQCNQMRYHCMIPMWALIPNATADTPLFDPTKEPQKWVDLVFKMKAIFKRFQGTQKMHNFHAGLVPHEGAAQIFNKSFCHYGQAYYGGVPWLCVAMLCDNLLSEQVQRMGGLMLAVMRGLLPMEYIDHALSDEIVETPKMPPNSMYLAEAFFSKSETQNRVLFRPRREDKDVKLGYDYGFDNPMLFRNMEIWRARVQAYIAWNETRGKCLETWVTGELEQSTQMLLERMLSFKALQARNLAEAGSEAGPDDETEVVHANATVHRAYMRVLRLLQAADRGGQWPQCSAGRTEVMKEGTVEAGGGSFSVGSMPPPLRVPAANEIFPELMAAAFQLERVLMPDREGSSTIAINRNAQFRPHKDSGGGSGQSTSLIVGLGNYTGGQLMVEGEHHDIRYRPLEFNGWTQRHWTLPFSGERFSLVWFTPNGCEGMKGLDLELSKQYA